MEQPGWELREVGTDSYVGQLPAPGGNIGRALEETFGFLNRLTDEAFVSAYAHLLKGGHCVPRDILPESGAILFPEDALTLEYTHVLDTGEVRNDSS